MLVAHSQGGLVVQRYLARMLNDGRSEALSSICGVILFACPNSGSEFGLTLRRASRWRHPQEPELRPINEAITAAQRVVLNRVVHAKQVTATDCPIPVVAYAGESDDIVKPASANHLFPQTGVIPGDHLLLTTSSVTPLLNRATQGIVEPADEQLIALFTAWRADIDSAPFAHGHAMADGLAAYRRRPPCTRPGYRTGPKALICRRPSRPT